MSLCRNVSCFFSRVGFNRFVISLFMSSVLLIPSLSAAETAVSAQTSQQPLQQTPLQIDARQQQRQAEQNRALQQQQVMNPEVRLQTEPNVDDARPLLTPEAQCLTISELYLTDFNPDAPDLTEYSATDADKDVGKKGAVPPKSQFASALKAVYRPGDFSLPHCVGGEGIGILIKRVQNAIVEQGFVTTRVLVQPQDLRSGRLILTVIPGTIHQIQLRDNSAYPKATLATPWFALPMGAGDVLNIRDIEQGLENFKRPSHADANIQIVPAAEGSLPGESDLVIEFEQHFPYRLTLGLDDSGSKSTGRLQGSATVSIENLLSFNDLFYAAFTRSFKRDSDDDGPRGSENVSAYYAVPWKNWLLSASASQYDYHQTVFGSYVDYRYAGKSTTVNGTLSRVLYRDQQRKTTAGIGVWHRRSTNTIDDAEVEVQRRRMAGWQLNLQHKEYIGNATLDVGLGYKRGTGANGALPAPEEFFGEGTSRPKIITADISLNLPFALGEQPWRYYTSWRGQWNKTPLIQQDKFSIGGRYTVRGFDGELTLSGDRGWLWRNELAWNVMRAGHEVYWALDKGVVRGRGTDELPGRHLVGAAMGLRGVLWGLNYDYFVGTPIHKPQGFRTSHVTTGFSLSYQF